MLAALICSPQLFASAWIGTQDKQLHYDVQTLAEWGYLQSAVTTYPIPWKGVATELKSINPQGMPATPARAYARLMHSLSIQEQQAMRYYATLQLASDDVRFRSLDDGVEETAELSLSTEFYYGRWSGQVAVNYASGGQTNLDNSFLAYQFGEWNIRAGSLDQFWGPAQSSSLILSNNARPLKAVALSRSVTTGSKHPWLSWLGPWYFTTQLGQMEKDRVIPDTKLLLSRFTARPFHGFELGLSWAAMWGGEGQDNDLKAFWEVITFQTVCLDRPVCTDEQLTTRGNHLAGIDLSYTFNLLERPMTLYIQRIGEDAVDGYRITDNANLFGLSSYVSFAEVSAKVFIESSDTNIACQGDGSTVTNCYYENGLYESGYRLYERAIGSTFDSDAKQITLGTNIRFEDGAVAELYLRSVELNSDGEFPSPVLTKDVSEDLLELSGFYQRPFGNWLLKAGGSVVNRDFENEEDEVDALVYLKAQYAF